MKCFKRDYSKPSREYGSHGEGEIFIPKWGYIVPHTESAQGAETIDGKWSEYTHGLAVSTKLGLPWDDRNDGGVYSACKRLKALGVNSTWEDHRNAFNRTVGGAEILCLHGDQLSIEKAEMILESFHSAFPKRNIRGIKPIRKSGRGYNNLLASKKAGMDVALLGELFFIDNPADFIPADQIAAFLKKVLI